MTGFNTRIHAIGDKRNGIVIVTFDPFRVVTIGADTIKKYSEDSKLEEEQVFTMVARAVLSLIGDLSEGDLLGRVDSHEEAIQELFRRGIRMCDADFALSGFIDPSLHHADSGLASRRKAYKMLHELVEVLTAPDAKVRTPQEIMLRSRGHD